MNRKHIANRLRRVFKDFVTSIDDKEVQKLVRKNTIIMGGAIPSLIMNDTPNDYDMYFRNKETVLAVARYYVNKFNDRNTITNNCNFTGQKAFVLDGAFPIEEQIVAAGEKVWNSQMLTNITEDRVKVIVRSDGVASENEPPVDEFDDPDLVGVQNLLDEADNLPDDIIDQDPIPAEEKAELPKYRPVFLSTNAITLSDKVQLIIRFYGEPADIEDSYDFIHCCNYWDSASPGKVVCTLDSMEAIQNKQLIYRGSHYPLCSIFRIRKFLARGWTINAGQIVKMGFQLSRLDLTDVDTLEDQLVGVDTLYFKQFIESMRKAQQLAEENGADFNITENYVSTLIDKIF